MKLTASKVVIAQTDSGISTQFGPLLLKEGFEVQALGGGEDLVSQIKKGDVPDLIVLDRNLASPTPVEICHLLKSDFRSSSLPILVIETVPNTADIAEIIQAGADDFLSYPVVPVSFLARIKSLLRLKSLTRRLDDAESVLATLTRTIEAKDKYTMGHADRVAHFAIELGKALGVQGRDLETLRKGGMLHDVGKIAIPDAILLKPGKYTAEEFAIMKKHPSLGCEICEKLRSVKDAIPLIRHHHERLDGTGYPDRLKEGEILPLVRIINVVDIYDALRSRRSYKDAFDMEKSFETMWDEVRKGWWDGEVLACWEKFCRSREHK